MATGATVEGEGRPSGGSTTIGYGPVRGRGVDSPMPQVIGEEGSAPTGRGFSDARTGAASGQAHPHVSELSESDVRDLSTKLIDLRGLVRPAPFTGEREDWPEFRFRLESVATLMGLDDVMEKAVVGQDWQMTVAEEKISRFLHALLATLLHGKALAIVRLAPKKNGIVAWHNLVSE
jgi:hypothetical protein